MIVITISVLLLAGGFWLSDYGNGMAIFLQTIGVLLMLYGWPSYANKIVSKRFSRFGLLVKGEEPYDKLSALPKRIVVMTIYAFVLVALGGMMIVGLYFGIKQIK